MRGSRTKRLRLLAQVLNGGKKIPGAVWEWKEEPGKKPVWEVQLSVWRKWKKLANEPGARSTVPSFASLRDSLRGLTIMPEVDPESTPLPNLPSVGGQDLPSVSPSS